MKEKVPIRISNAAKFIFLRGIFDKIGDIEYQKHQLRIGFRSNKIPVKSLIDMTILDPHKFVI
jgi:hypothetical protein